MIMLPEAKERPRLSPKALTALRSMADHSAEQERAKSVQQEAPDGSGKGRFHELLSHYMRRWAYETDRHTFFYQSGWDGENRVFQMLEGDRLEAVRKVILEYRDVDILE